MAELGAFATLAIAVFGLILFVLAILMPIFVYQIASNSAKTLQETQTLNHNINLLLMLTKAKNGVRDSVVECPNPKCQAKVSYSFDRAGQQTHCPKCHKGLLLPG